MIKPVCLVARLQWIKHAHSSNSFSAEGAFSLSHIIAVTSHCVPTLGKDLKQDSQNIWSQFFVCLGGKEKLGGLALPVLIKAELQHSDTFSRKIYSRQHFLNKVLSVKWSRVYFNIIYLGIQVVWVYYPRTCQDVLTKKINSEPFRLKKKKSNIWKVTLWASYFLEKFTRGPSCVPHTFYNLNFFLFFPVNRRNFPSITSVQLWDPYHPLHRMYRVLGHSMHVYLISQCFSAQFEDTE